ncbi:hypothetical protein [Streptomyces vietnamensis]|uniref:hypothetical protein n=1 Tax=Streptomyces vietnamensis TaxID=362257 RepID=UPI000695F5B8|nr:hypothetical protein [Streptomyces vietnamensis]
MRSVMAPYRQRGFLLVLVAALAVSACTSSSDSGSEKDKGELPTVSAAPSKSATVDPSEAAKAEAISTYTSYWTELPKVYAIPSIDGTDLKRYTAAEALSQAEAGVKNLKTTKSVMTGLPVMTNPTVTDAALDKKTPSVTISSCLDVSQWKIIDKASGKPAVMPSNRVTKYVVVSLVERWPDGWKVLKAEPKADQPC